MVCFYEKKKQVLPLDAGDLQASQAAAVPHGAVVTFAAAVLIRQHLLSLELGHHLGLDRGTARV